MLAQEALTSEWKPGHLRGHHISESPVPYATEAHMSPQWYGWGLILGSKN